MKEGAYHLLNFYSETTNHVYREDDPRHCGYGQHIFSAAMAAPFFNTTTTTSIAYPLASQQKPEKRNADVTCVGQSQWARPSPGTSNPYREMYPESTWNAFDCAFEVQVFRPLIISKTSRPEDAEQVRQAIMYATSVTGVDARLLLAIAMQESHGELRVGHTTAADASSSNGIMQCDACATAAHFPPEQPS